MQICTSLGHIKFFTLAILLCLVSQNSAWAQIIPLEEGPAMSSTNIPTTDSTPAKKIKRSDPKWQYAHEISMANDSFYSWDSTFTYIQRYNKIHKTGIPYTDLGNTASPQLLLYFNPFVESGFNTGLKPYRVQNKTPDSLKFYKAAVPFTRFAYTQGGQGVFILDAMHTQNLAQGWNVSIDFSSVQNQQVYTGSGQNHLHRGTMAGSNYTNKKGNYQNTIILSWNRGRRAENRGLQNDTFFYRPTDGNSRVVGKYIPESNSAQSAYKQRHHVLEQHYLLGAEKNFSIFHRFDWIKESYEYNENEDILGSDTLFYGTQPYFYNGAFKDSSVWVQWNNSFGIRIKSKNKAIPFVLKTWYALDKIAYNSIYKTAANTTYNQSLQAALTAQTAHLTAHANTAIYFDGWNAGNYKFSADLRYNLASNWGVLANIKSQIYRPVYISERYGTNYIRYAQNRPSTAANALSAGAWWSQKILFLSGQFTTGTASKFLYLDTDGIFNQLNQLNYYNFKGNVKIKLGRFYIDQSFYIQSHSQLKEIPVPKFSSITGIYFQANTFKKAMLTRIGTDIWYCSKYNGYHYQPMNATFYPGAKKSGNYPFVDLYLSGEVKTVMFYLKLEHANQFLADYGFNDTYSGAIGYPNEPLRFRFGIVWRFYN